MKSYTQIIEEFVDEFTTDPNEVRSIVVETAEQFREEYYRIASVDEDDFDQGELDDFFKNVEDEISLSLKASGIF